MEVKLSLLMKRPGFPPRSLDSHPLFLTLVIQGDAVRWFLETWFHQIPPTMSRSLIYIVLKTEEQESLTKKGILYSYKLRCT